MENRDVAIKELLFEVADSLTDSMLNNFLVEIKLMSALTHPKIVEFIGITLPSPHKLCLVTELMHQGSLRDVLDRKGKNLPWKLRFKLAKDAAKGMFVIFSLFFFFPIKLISDLLLSFLILFCQQKGVLAREEGDPQGLETPEPVGDQGLGLQGRRLWHQHDQTRDHPNHDLHRNTESVLHKKKKKRRH